MKFALLRFAVLAMKLPTFTCAPWPITTPFGLTSSTWPFASRRPSSVDTWPPVTRFRVADRAPGCWNSTCSPTPMPKLRQSITARSLDCWMRVCGPAAVMLAVPARTTPSWGPASAALVIPASTSAAAIGFNWSKVCAREAFMDVPPMSETDRQSAENARFLVAFLRDDPDHGLRRLDHARNVPADAEAQAHACRRSRLDSLQAARFALAHPAV